MDDAGELSEGSTLALAVRLAGETAVSTVLFGSCETLSPLDWFACFTTT